MYQLLWPCRHVPACANMCNHSQHLWYQPLETYLECWHVSAHLDILTCADMCRHVPTCDINHDTSYSDHLDLIGMLACVSICGHTGMCYVPTCETTLSTFDTNHLKLILHAGMCQHIWTCRHVLIYADMCWHVPTCDINHDTSYSDHLYLIWMLACVSICGHMPTCADMCRYVLTCADMWHYSRHLW